MSESPIATPTPPASDPWVRALTGTSGAPVSAVVLRCPTNSHDRSKWRRSGRVSRSALDAIFARAAALNHEWYENHGQGD